MDPEHDPQPDRPRKDAPRSDTRRGTRHLRLRIEIGVGAPRIVSMWMVEQPAVQLPRLVHPIVFRVELAGQLVFLDSAPDARVLRGTYRERVGHSFTSMVSGIVEVSVPFTDARQLAGLRIRMADVSRVPLRTREPGEVAPLFERPPDTVRMLGEIDAEALRNHPDWSKIGVTLGVPAEAGRFEVYVDRAGQYRWRLRRAGGDILADSGEGYATREACEADLRWVRGYAGSVPVVPLDVRPPARPGSGQGSRAD
jgi:uncharacterized protein